MAKICEACRFRLKWSESTCPICGKVYGKEIVEKPFMEIRDSNIEKYLVNSEEPIATIKATDNIGFKQYLLTLTNVSIIIQSGILEDDHERYMLDDIEKLTGSR
jgi:hypothetical protein